MTAIADLINTTKTYYCLDCGVCTGSCPVSRVFPEFSPRQIIERSLYELEELLGPYHLELPDLRPVQRPLPGGHQFS